MKIRYQTINNASIGYRRPGALRSPAFALWAISPAIRGPFEVAVLFQSASQVPGLEWITKKTNRSIDVFESQGQFHVKPLLAFRSSLSSDMHTGCGSSARTWFDWGRGRSVSIGVVSSGRWENGRIEVGAAGRGLGVDFMIFHRLMKARERDLEGAE